MSTGNGRPLGRPPHKNSKAALLQPGDEVGAYAYAQLLRMDRRYVAAAEEAIRFGLERRTSAFAEQRTGASDRARGTETGIYGTTLRWARIRSFQYSFAQMPSCFSAPRPGSDAGSPSPPPAISDKLLIAMSESRRSLR